MQRVGKVEIYALQGGKSREIQPRFAKAHLVMLSGQACEVVKSRRGYEATARTRLGRGEAARLRRGCEALRPRQGCEALMRLRGRNNETDFIDITWLFKIELVLQYLI